MHVQKCDLGDFKEIEILALADWHIGDKQSDGKKIQEYLDYIQSKPNVFVILNGDFLNNAVKNSVSDIYSEQVNPMEALKQCVKLFTPIKDRILCIEDGNHERRSHREAGVDLTQIMATQLGLGDRYSNASTLLFVTFGKWRKGGHHPIPVTYTIYCVHGSGGGRKEGGKIQRLVDLSAIIDADIYVHSHTHFPAIVRNSYYRVHATTKSVQQVDKLYVNTSSALQYGGYGEIASFKPNSLETPIIKLDGTRHRMRAEL